LAFGWNHTTNRAAPFDLCAIFASGFAARARAAFPREDAESLDEPREVTRIAVRFSPVGEPDSASCTFDVTAEPGYVWHCHILEHEDNEMMRPYKLLPAAP
jgi:hypothetical protein